MAAIRGRIRAPLRCGKDRLRGRADARPSPLYMGAVARHNLRPRCRRPVAAWHPPVHVPAGFQSSGTWLLEDITCTNVGGQEGERAGGAEALDSSLRGASFRMTVGAGARVAQGGSRTAPTGKVDQSEPARTATPLPPAGCPPAIDRSWRAGSATGAGIPSWH